MDGTADRRGLKDWWHGLADATTWLFVPGNRPDRFDRALSSGADVVIADLEDAVAPAEADIARAAVLVALKAPQSHQLVVRISAPGTPAFEEDLRLLAQVAQGSEALGSGALRGVMVSKAHDAAGLVEVAERLGSPALIPLVEDAAGVVNLEGICSAGLPLESWRLFQ